MTFILKNESPILKVISWIIYICQIVSYTVTFSANPGIPDTSMSINNESNKNFKGSICKRCGICIPKGKRVVHCDDCDVCIVGYDHHCPWTSKCIGRGNMLSFQAFITFTMIFFGFLIFSVAIMKK